MPMINLRSAKIKDIKQIQETEKKYYEGFSYPEKTLKNWIRKTPSNFIVAEKNGKIIGFIFFEYVKKAEAIPFVHQPENNRDGKYIYISEIAVLEKHKDILQELFDRIIIKAKKNKIRKIVWLTGQKKKHDKIERELLLKNDFRKIKHVENWEAYPNYFVSDHWLWEKSI